jgi:aminoglycoside phosphotransferase (APT) family kinase protein
VQLLTSDTALPYLRERGLLAADEPAVVSTLSGGVSSEVLLIEPAGGAPFVLKQVRERLKVAQDWTCDIRRLWREIDVLRLCSRIVSHEQSFAVQATVPHILLEDRENYCYAMSAAEPGHRTWKQGLLAGEADPNVAAATGRLLGTLHAKTWNDAQVAADFGDRSFFDALRLDPYYRRIAEVHPELRSAIQALIDSVLQHPLCLVHGDFSPKNLLVSPKQLMLIDFEVGHYGDPAFDLGFCVTHLVLKAIWSGERRMEYLTLTTAFWQAYREKLAGIASGEVASLEQRAVVNLAGCMLARVDGKSPVDYLAESHQAVLRQLARRWLAAPPVTLQSAFDEVARS